MAGAVAVVDREQDSKYCNEVNHQLPGVVSKPSGHEWFPEVEKQTV
jgi:hypothetical protein